MRRENGFYIMTSAEYEKWVELYNAIMDNPESSQELLVQTEKFNEMIAMEG